MNKIVLRQPLMINGKKVSELTYDTSKISTQMFCAAESRQFAAAGNSGQLAMHEFDHGFHLYLGFYAIIAVNQHIDITDLERITGYDAVVIMKVGRNFILTGSGSDNDSDQKISDDTSEAMPERSAAQ